MSGFPVLMYHRIASALCPVPDGAEAPYAVAVDEFAWQLDFLRVSGLVGVSMARIHATLAAGGEIPENWVGMTFDDGNRSDVQHALPLLGSAGFDATFYIGVSRIAGDGELDESMVRRLSDEGMHVGSHGVTHRFLSTLPGDEEMAELKDSRFRLESIIGRDVNHFAPPGGRYTRRTLQTLDRSGYVAVATSRFGLNRARGPRFVYNRIPIMAATSHAGFANIVSRNARAMFPAYMKSRTLNLVRRAIGEAAYRRVRKAAGRG